MTKLADDTVGTMRIGDHVVRRLGFGAARVSGARGRDGTRDRELGRALCRRAVERGVNFIDVAALYGRGECEEIVAEALAPYPEDLLVASKAGMVPVRNDEGRAIPTPDGHPETIVRECDRSLARLRLDRLDVYQIHMPDPNVPWEDTVGAFRDLQDAGKIGHVGLSNVSVEQLVAAEAITPIVSVQNYYNPALRGSEPVLKACEERGIAFIPYSPNLTGGGGPAVDAVAEVADAHGVSPQQVGVRWLLYHSPVNVPIPGTTQLAHVDDNIDLAWLELTPDEIARIDSAAAPRSA
jgi:aryl-alcohol dehydrogenase-like predicted oxidoreductase